MVGTLQKYKVYFTEYGQGGGRSTTFQTSIQLQIGTPQPTAHPTPKPMPTSAPTPLPTPTPTRAPTLNKAALLRRYLHSFRAQWKTLSAPPPRQLAYGHASATYMAGVAIQPNVPSWLGGKPTSYVVEPPLEQLTGLLLNESSGAIHGVPRAIDGAQLAAAQAAAGAATGVLGGSWNKAVSQAVPFRITARNAGGATRRVVWITVADALSDAQMRWLRSALAFHNGSAVEPCGTALQSALFAQPTSN
jgi:hypothetical protein